MEEEFTVARWWCFPSGSRGWLQAPWVMGPGCGTSTHRPPLHRVRGERVSRKVSVRKAKFPNAYTSRGAVKPSQLALEKRLLPWDGLTSQHEEILAGLGARRVME